MEGGGSTGIEKAESETPPIRNEFGKMTISFAGVFQLPGLAHRRAVQKSSLLHDHGRGGCCDSILAEGRRLLGRNRPFACLNRGAPAAHAASVRAVCGEPGGLLPLSHPLGTNPVVSELNTIFTLNSNYTNYSLSPVFHFTDCFMSHQW